MNRQLRYPALLAVFVLFLALPTNAPVQTYEESRGNLVREIERNVFDTRDYIGKRMLHERVMKVIGKVPRHEFVPKEYRGRAYKNRPLPIGFGQTISQPYIVALMTDLLELEAGDVVLELGTTVLGHAVTADDDGRMMEEAIAKMKEARQSNA